MVGEATKDSKTKKDFDDANQPVETNPAEPFKFSPEILAKLEGRKGRDLTDADKKLLVETNNDGGSQINSSVKGFVAKLVGSLMALVDEGLVGGVLKKIPVAGGLVPDRPIFSAMQEVIGDVNEPIPNNATVIVDENELFSDCFGRFDEDINAYIVPASLVEMYKAMGLNDVQAERMCVSMHDAANSKHGGYLQSVMDYINKTVGSTVASITALPGQALDFIKSKVGLGDKEEPKKALPAMAAGVSADVPDPNEAVS
ncbi:MAG: hypothetical protein ACT4OY_05125 [Alphaproteobacteria bacterium]